MNQASLLGICLGVGILLCDVECALFIEADGYANGTPGYIIQSIWTSSDYDKLWKYIKRLQKCLQGDGGAKGCVN